MSIECGICEHDLRSGHAPDCPRALPTVALSIRQPWAWLIIRPDLVEPSVRARAAKLCQFKTHENRDWPTKRRGRVLVHAAKGMTRGEWEDGMATAHHCGVPADVLERHASFHALERGGIIGSVEIADCVEHSDSPWFFGRFGFVLRDPRPMPFRPVKGALGFFKVSA